MGDKHHKAWVQIQLSHLLLTSHLTSLSLSFIICKMGCRTSQGHGKVKWDNECKAFVCAWKQYTPSMQVTFSQNIGLGFRGCAHMSQTVSVSWENSWHTRGHGTALPRERRACWEDRAPLRTDEDGQSPEGSLERSLLGGQIWP